MDCVADVDADSKLHSASFFDPGVPCRYRLLSANGALNRVHDASELSEDVIASGINHAPAMARDHVKNGRQMILQVTDGPGLIGPQQCAVVGNIGCRIAANR